MDATMTGAQALSQAFERGDGTAVQQWDALVDSIKKADVKMTWADANLAAATTNPPLAAARNRALSTPIIHGVAQVPAETPSIAPTTTRPTTTTPTSSVIAFDALVDSIKAEDSRMSWADAILQAAAKDPDLARARNAELSGAVTMSM